MNALKLWFQLKRPERLRDELISEILQAIQNFAAKENWNTNFSRLKGRAIKMDVAEAESRARRYIKKKYSNRKIKILIKETSRGHDGWLVNGEIHIRKALIFTVERRFNLRVNSKTGEVTYYKEIKT